MMTSSFSLRWRSLLAAALMVCAASLFAADQGAAPSPDSQDAPASGLNIKKTVRRVIVDVVVTDSSDKPVRGLTTQDFSLVEDGKAQKILSFDVHDLTSASESAKLPPLPPNTFVNVPTSPERGPLYVMLLDLVHMDTDDQPIARRQMLQFIVSKPAGTRFAIFALTDGLHLIQGFTDDQDQLMAALNPNRPGRHIPRIFIQSENYQRISPLGILLDIAHFLDGQPGRKNLIWVSGSFPSTILPTAEKTAESVNYSDEIKAATDAMAREQIAVYPVDVRGPVVTSVSATRGVSGTGQSVASPNDEGGGSGGGGSDSGNAGVAELNGSYMTEDQIAHATGGRAFYSTNDLKEALSQATEAGANYYTLSYSPTNQKYEGKLRNIYVELSKRGYRLAYRRSYYGQGVDSPKHPENTPPNDSLYASMKHGAPIAHQLLLRAHVHTVGAPAKATPEQMSNLAQQTSYFQAQRKSKRAKALPPIELQTYAIDYTVILGQSTSLIAALGKESLTLEFATAVFNADGEMLNGTIQSAVQSASPDKQVTNPEGMYRVQQEIDAPLTATSIRVAVRDVSTDRVGAMEVALPLSPELQAQAPNPAPTPVEKP
jgi:VWFA-related protein